MADTCEVRNKAIEEQLRDADAGFSSVSIIKCGSSSNREIASARWKSGHISELFRAIYEQDKDAAHYLRANAAREFESLKAENAELKANLKRNAEAEGRLARERLASANEADALRRKAEALVNGVLAHPQHPYARLIMRQEFASLRAALLHRPVRQEGE